MLAKIKAKRVLKQFGKAAYKERVGYVDSMLKTEESYVKATNLRHMIRRSLIIVAIMILTLALVVVGADALEINALNFSFVNKIDYEEAIDNNSEEGTEAKAVIFYEIGYISEGYTLLSEESFRSAETKWVYQNKDKVYLYIQQEKSRRLCRKFG